MDQEQRNSVIASFEKYQLSTVARELLDRLIQTWEEAIGNDDGLEFELYRLADDEQFMNYVFKRRPVEQTRGIELIHALQDLRLISRLSQRYFVLAKVHLDRD